MTAPESALKKKFKDYIEYRGGFWSSIQAGPGSKIGDPDMIACYKGVYVAIEGKTYEGSQSEWQKLRQKQIQAAGGIYLLARTVEDIADTFDEIDKQKE